MALLSYVDQGYSYTFTFILTLTFTDDSGTEVEGVQDLISLFYQATPLIRIFSSIFFFFYIIISFLSIGTSLRILRDILQAIFYVPKIRQS